MTKKYEVRRVCKLLVAGNSTMPKSVGIFNLPALKTCLPSDWCKEHCYALRGRFVWSNVKAAHQWRLEQSRQIDFVRTVEAEIGKSYFRYIRIHISGDFYSKAYVLKWAMIARKFSHKIFRTNTKRIDFLRYMLQEFPENVVVRESTDVTQPSMGVYPQAAIIGTPGSKKFFVCHDDCDECKFYCWHNPDINVVTSQIR